MAHTSTGGLTRKYSRYAGKWLQAPKLHGERSLPGRVAHQRCRVDSERSLAFTNLSFAEAELMLSQRAPYALKGVSFGGAGIFFWWELGCVLWLLKHVDVETCPFFGASGGALAATLVACKVDPFEAFDVALRISEESGLFQRPLGLAGVWGGLIRDWLDELLPEDAAEICKDQVSLVVTTLPTFSLETISDFESREALIDANMASVHIPFFLDGKLSKRFREWECVDGSVQDFFTGTNSDVLTCNGTTLLFDYFDDDNLSRKRFDFLALKRPAEVLNMIRLGYEYTERLSREETFQKALVN